MLIGITLWLKLNFITYAVGGDITTYAVERMFKMNDMFNVLEELDKALTIRKAKKTTTSGDITTVKQIVNLFEGYEEKIFIDFFRVDESKGIHECEVVIASDELEDDILSQKVESMYICDDCVTLRVDILKYLDAVIKNPTTTPIRKAMLNEYRFKVATGEVFQ